MKTKTFTEVGFLKWTARGRLHYLPIRNLEKFVKETGYRGKLDFVTKYLRHSGFNHLITTTPHEHGEFELIFSTNELDVFKSLINQNIINELIEIESFIQKKIKLGELIEDA